MPAPTSDRRQSGRRLLRGVAGTVAVAVTTVGLADLLHGLASRRRLGTGPSPSAEAQRTAAQRTAAQRTGAQRTGAQRTGAQRTGAQADGTRADGAQADSGAGVGVGAGVGSGPEADRRAQVVLVLGFPANRRGSLRPLQRWRTEIGVRSLEPGGDSLLIFSGGGPAGAPTEAETMAAYARDVLGVPAHRIRLETSAKSTWENIAFSLPWLEPARTIAIASDPLHAARGRLYLHRQRPDLATRLVPADDYRPFDHWRLKVPTAVYAVTRPPMRRLRARLYPPA
ncbi:hypothetical protein FAIPA1_60194 [Frankia sp. AiPs1]|uniref:YdcF family protein n=1 Tax=Frankia sp. AiPa1 TaxID=573492 RepID=UPI00202BA217|nr:YdcF family protein [Frankia sp. AiPa1]MCL9760573.1 YdcF family protein [Frankia sp. AiPa1]